MDTKLCRTCQRELEATAELFPRCKKHPDGLQYKCRECTAEYSRIYYASRAEHLKDRAREHRLANKDQYREAKRRKYVATRKDMLRKEAERYRSDPSLRQRKKEAATAWQAANPERRAVMRREWDKKNKAAKRANKSRRRARLRTAIVERVMPVEVFAKTEGLCVYCGVRLDLSSFHMDHAMPISRGGHHTIGNLVPSCEPCNLRKGNKTADEFRAWSAAKLGS